MGIWKFDPYHAQVELSAKHLGMNDLTHFGTDPTDRRRTCTAR